MNFKTITNAELDAVFGGGKIGTVVKAGQAVWNGGKKAVGYVADFFKGPDPIPPQRTLREQMDDILRERDEVYWKGGTKARDRFDNDVSKHF